MSTLVNLWNQYWWLLPLVLVLFCILGCRRGRKACAYGSCGTTEAKEGAER